MTNTVVVESQSAFQVSVDEIFTTDVVVDPSNDISIYLENPFIPANVDIASIGIQGPRGYAVLSGNGIPLITEGINNDLYINLTNGYLYKKISGLWVFQLPISPQKEEFHIDASILLDQKVVLDIPPNPYVVRISFIGGIEQANDDTSFYISGNEIKWDGISPTTGLPYEFQTLLEVGDTMVVTY